MNDIDATDRALVAALLSDGRATYADLARAVGLSPASVHERVRKLELAGVLAGYRAVVPPAAIGLGVSALVGVFTREGVDQEDVAASLRGVGAIEDCWAVAGDETFLLKIRTADVDALEATLNVLRRTPGVARTRTTVVLSTPWEGRLPPPT